MNAWQRFSAFSDAARAWCWILAAGAVLDLIYLVYLNVTTPYTFVSGNGNSVAMNVSQANNLCQNDLGSFSSSAMASCRNAASLEQQKAVFAVGIILIIIALAVILLVSARKTQGLASQPQPNPRPSQPPGTHSQPGFYEDPTARYARRYFDGSEWTSRVSAGLGATEQADKAWQDHPIITTPREGS